MVWTVLPGLGLRRPHHHRNIEPVPGTPVLVLPGGEHLAAMSGLAPRWMGRLRCHDAIRGAGRVCDRVV